MPRNRSGSSRPISRLLGLLAAGLVLAAVVVTRFWSLTTMPRPLVDLYLDVVGSSVALSPDGRSLAYAVREGDGSILELRRVGERGARRIREARGAKSPFFSPDGRVLGFLDASGVKRVLLDSYEVEEVLAVENAEDASFGEDGSVLLASTDRLFRISSSGRTEILVEENVRSPLSVPGSEWVLFEAEGENESHLEALSLESGTRRRLVPEASLPRFFPPEHLLFLRDSAVWTSRVDPAAAELRGEPVLLIPGVDWFDVAANGTLAFRTPGVPRPRLRIVLHWDEELKRAGASGERARR
jgi:hypothetical protein